MHELIYVCCSQVYPSDVNFAVSFLERVKTGYDYVSCTCKLLLFTSNCNHAVCISGSLQADRVRGSASECEVVLQTFGQALLYLLLNVDTHTLALVERQQFYRTLLNMVSYGQVYIHV